MKLVLSILLVLIGASIFTSSGHQNRRSQDLTLEKVIYKFYPSFIYSSHFIIAEDESVVKFEIIKPADFFGKNERQLITYGSLNIDSSKIKQLMKVNRDLYFDSTRIDERRLLDGISGRIEKYDNNKNYETLKFRSPTRQNFELDYKSIDAFFLAIEENAESNQYLREYLERLKGYFDYGLPIKQIGEDPLEYRLWGSITSNEEQELYLFLDSLPRNEPIIFDVTNFPGMGNMFHGKFQSFNERHNIYYLSSNKLFNTDLKSIGNCKMYYDRGKMKKRISEDFDR